MGEQIDNYYNNEELKKLIEIYGTTDKTELRKLIKANSLNTENKTLNLDEQIKELRIRKLIADCRISESRATYYETFGVHPSPEAEKAMKTYAENKTRDFTSQEYENVLKYITLKNHNFKWLATCDVCKEGETYDTRLDAVHDMIRHLTTEHSKKVMEIRN